MKLSPSRFFDNLRFKVRFKEFWNCLIHFLESFWNFFYQDNFTSLRLSIPEKPSVSGIRDLDWSMEASTDLFILGSLSTTFIDIFKIYLSCLAIS